MINTKKFYNGLGRILPSLVKPFFEIIQGKILKRHKLYFRQVNLSIGSKAYRK